MWHSSIGQAVEVINAMQSDVGENEGKSFVLRVDGGASENNLLMQLQVHLENFQENEILAYSSISLFICRRIC